MVVVGQAAAGDPFLDDGDVVGRPAALPRMRALRRCVAEERGDVHQLVGTALVPAGARCRLSEPDRQLDANLIHLPAGQRMDTHTEPDLDVVLVVVAGAGAVGTPDWPWPLAEGNLVWLPTARPAASPPARMGCHP
jgi:hypothetical protein